MYRPRHMMRILAFFLLAIAHLGVLFAHAEIIIDNGGGDTSSTGIWQVSDGTSPYGANSLWGQDGATYTWKMTSQAAGTYEVFMWWSGFSSRAANVPVTIVHRDGSATFSINQKQNAGKWNNLGQYYFNGTGSVSIKAASGKKTEATCADAVRFVNVGGSLNTPPTAVNDTAATTMNTPVTVDVISNDTDDGGISASSVSIGTSPASGTAVLNGNGTVTYTPNTGYIGADTFTYAVADTQGAVSNQATVTVMVNAASAETVIDNGGPGTSYTGTWAVSGATGAYGSPSVWSRDGTAYNWTFIPSVSGNYDVSMWWTVYSSRSTGVPVDIEHSGGTEYLFINQQQNGGKWNSLGIYSLIAGQSYTVTVVSQPGPSSTCADAVRFAYLGGGGNSPPIARNDSATTTMNTPIAVDVISNDTDDVGIDAGTVAIVTSPPNGTAVPKTDGTMTYTPGEAFTGTDTFTYTVADTQGAVSNPATITITVNAQNSPPSAADDSAMTGMNTPVTINVLSNDTDDGGIIPASLAIVSSPVSGTAIPFGNGTVTYTPGTGFLGADAFTYTVADAQGAVSNHATVTVTVNAASTAVVVDTGNSGTSYTGSWAVSGATGSYGSTSLWSRDGATYTWNFTPTVSATYDVSMWWTIWPSRSTSIPVDIQHAGGTTRVTINQQQNGGQWNSLGLFSFAAGVRYSVKITSQAGPSSTCADAVKFTNVGDVGNLPPTAVIDSIRPNPSLPGAAVEFTGHGTDSDGGDIFAYSWRSNIDGVLSNSASFSTTALSTGQHTIYFKVQDDMGSWSTETSAHIDVTQQALSTEHIYVAMMYGAPLNIYYKDMIESLGGYREGDVWKYTNLSNGKTYIIHFVTNMEAAKLALYTENAHIILGGHSNYGLGGLFNVPGDSGWIIPTVYYIDDIRIWNYSTPTIGVNVSGLIQHQSYPNWWPEFQDGTSGIMPYDLHDPRGNPPYNYYITYQIPGDPTHYKIESVRNGAPERYPSSDAAAWYSPDGSTPSATNPSHAGYFITNSDTGVDYGICGANPCPKPHYGSRTIISRKDLEIDVSKLKYKKLMIDTCSSNQYFLGTFSKGIVFYTLGSVDGQGGMVYLNNVLRGRNDEELWLSLGGYQGLFDYYDFNKRPTEQ